MRKLVLDTTHKEDDGQVIRIHVYRVSDSKIDGYEIHNDRHGQMGCLATVNDTSPKRTSDFLADTYHVAVSSAFNDAVAREKIYPEIAVPFDRHITAPTFPKTCPICGAARTFVNETMDGSATYACGGSYNVKSQCQNHTQKWWGKCGAEMGAYVKRVSSKRYDDEPPMQVTTVVTKTPPPSQQEPPPNYAPGLEFVICTIAQQYDHLAESIADMLNALP